MKSAESPSERFPDVGLKVQERPGHGIFFEFNPGSAKISEIYNRVIEEVLSKVGSPTPHGPMAEGRGYQPGYQSWQIEAIDIQMAQDLIPTINTLAQKLFEEGPK